MAYPHPFSYPVTTPAENLPAQGLPPQQTMQPPPQTGAAAAAGGPFQVAYASGYIAGNFANANPRGPLVGTYPGFFPGAGGGGGATYGVSPFPVAGTGPGPGISAPGGGAAAGIVPPGSTAYFTTPHLGGFFADTYTEQKRQQQNQLLQQQMHQTLQQQQTQVDGRLYNGWMGVPDDENNQDEGGDGQDKKGKKHKSRAKAGSSDNKKDKKGKRRESRATSWNKVPIGPFAVLSPTEPTRHAKDGKKRRQCRHRRRQGRATALGLDGGVYDPRNENDSDAYSSLCSSDSDSNSSPSPSRADNARFRANRTRPTSVCDVPLHPGGSGRIIVHYTGGTPPGTDDRSSHRSRPGGRRHRHRRHRQHDGHHSGSDSDTDTDTAVSALSLSSLPSPPPISHTDAEDAAFVPATTSFAVSARRMRQTAKNWTRICRPGADACDTTVNDPAAVLGMYRMLEVLHTGVPPSRAAAAAERPMKEHSASSPPSSSSSSSSSPTALLASLSSTLPQGPFPLLSPTPVVLPPRVLAYVVLFGLELGALEPAAGTASMPDDAKKPQQQQQPNTVSSLLLTPAPASAPHQPPPLPNLLRARTAAWLDAFAYSVGSSGSSSSSSSSSAAAQDTTAAAPPPPPPPPHGDRPSPLARDWPYVLYTARVLGHRALFGACVRLLLEQWGPLVEAGEAGARLLAGLPPAMQATVQRDMSCLRAARMRSVESIVNAAMHTFPPPSL